MRRITSIRPGERFEGSFASYPTAELLIDLLRSNVSGALEIASAPHPGTFFFREGVPVSASAELGSPREALTQLVAEGTGSFFFLEGQAPAPGRPRVVLRTLQILFEGLCLPSARPKVARFLEEHRARRVRLTDTYPRGANPFGFSQEILNVLGLLESPTAPHALLSDASEPNLLGAALFALRLAEMVTFEGEDSGARPFPHAARDDSGGPSAEPDLMLDEDPPAARPRGDMSAEEVKAPPRTASGIDALRAQRAEIARAVDPLRGKDYLEILRVKPDTKPEQIERSRNYLAKQLAKGDGAGPDAIRDLLEEASVILRDPVRGAEYRKLAKNATTQKTLRKRQAFEAGPKLARAAAKMAQGEFGPAGYLIDWAAALDPELVETEGHRHFLEFCLQPGASKPEFAITLRAPMESLVERVPSSQSLRLYLVILYVAMGERELAQSLLSALTGAETHPLYPLAQVAVAALG